MDYKYRWFYAAFVMLIMVGFGFIYDIEPDLDRLSEQDRTEKQLSNQFAMIRQRALIIHSTRIGEVLTDPEMQIRIVSDLSTAARLHGLIIQSMHFPLSPNHFTDVLMMHVNVQGNFESFYYFFSDLVHKAYPILILDFSFTSTGHRQYVMSMDVLILKVHLPFLPVYETALIPRDPFCVTVRPVKVHLTNVHSVPIRELKMIGFLQQDQRAQAMILFPNGEVLEVENGMTIGKEQGLVANVRQEGIRFILANKEEFFLKM